MPDPRTLLPLKPLVFRVLVALGDDERHGWSLVRELQDDLHMPAMSPANFYRTLRGMVAAGLIVDVPRRPDPARALHDPPDERRRYFRITTLGYDAARLEARRLRDLVSDPRTRRLLK